MHILPLLFFIGCEPKPIVVTDFNKNAFDFSHIVSGLQHLKAISHLLFFELLQIILLAELVAHSLLENELYSAIKSPVVVFLDILRPHNLLVSYSICKYLAFFSARANLLGSRSFNPSSEFTSKPAVLSLA